MSASHASHAIQRVQLVTSIGVTLSLTSALTLAPHVALLGPQEKVWRLTVLTLGLTGLTAVLLWTRHRLRPLISGTPRARRRAAHDLPFQLTRLYFIAAVMAGLATAGLRWGYARDPNVALVGGVMTYLLLILPALGVYLFSRRILRPLAAGPPDPKWMVGIRQPVALRLAFAVQLPVVVCAAGIVLVEAGSGGQYAREVEAFDRQRYSALLHGTLRQLPAKIRSDFLSHLDVPNGIALPDDLQTVLKQAPNGFAVAVSARYHRPLALRLPPFALLGLITLLSALAGRWLAREVTLELKAARQTLKALGDGDKVPAEVEQATALQETATLLSAVRDALDGFSHRRSALRTATTQRRRAERAKAAFLARLSHELKSPLNTILGFSEMLLSGMEGPLTARQRQQLTLIWRSGDTLLRFILALLDMARFEQRSAPGIMAHSDIATLTKSLRRQHRVDPTGQIELSICQEEPTTRWRGDVNQTARSVLLYAGLLVDCMEAGAIEVRVEPGSGGVRLRVEVLSADADKTALAQLRAEIAETEMTAEIDASIHGTAAPALHLLRSIAARQRATLTLKGTPWPTLEMMLPAAPSPKEPSLKEPSAV